jgi:carbamoyl-phosphate synthase small subunit
MPKPARIALADGTVYRGTAFGATGVGVGEVCFNTSLTGYQEILTDPSYAGQIVAMTYPQIGNVGTNAEDEESRRPFLSGFVVKELFEPSNWRSRESLDAYLLRHGVPGIADLDTRALVRRIRDGGAQVGVLSTDPAQQDERALVARARADAGLEGRDLAAAVTCEAAYSWRDGRWIGIAGQVPRAARPTPVRRVVAYDFGIKRNILRLLVEQGCPRARPRRRCSSAIPTPCSCRTGPATPRRCTASASTCARSPRPSRSSGSASATRSSASRSAARRASSSSAITAATSRARTSRRARSRSAPRTTAMPSTPTRCAQPANPSGSRT